MKVSGKKLKFTHTINNRIIIWNRNISTRFRKRIPRPTEKTGCTLLVKQLDVQVSDVLFGTLKSRTLF